MIRVQRDDFDVGQELAQLTTGRTDIGGIGCFVGLVRANDEAGPADIQAMTLEHYPGMTEKQLAVIEAEAHQRWPLLGTTIIHRYGRLLPGEQIVLVLAASRHRQAALDATGFLIDWLKTRAPFWKLEETSQGSQWVAAKASDDQATERWTNS